MEHSYWQADSEFVPLTFVLSSFPLLENGPPLSVLCNLYSRVDFFMTPAVYFLFLLPTRCHHFPLFHSACFLIKNSSIYVSQHAPGNSQLVTDSPAVCPGEGGSHHIHAWTFDSSAKTMCTRWNAKGGSNYIVAPTPSFLISQAFMNLKGYFYPEALPNTRPCSTVPSSTL